MSQQKSSAQDKKEKPKKIEQLQKERSEIYETVRKQKDALDLFKADHNSKREEIEGLISRRVDIQQEQHDKKKELHKLKDESKRLQYEINNYEKNLFEKNMQAND